MKKFLKTLLLGVTLIYVSSCQKEFSDVALPESKAVAEKVSVREIKLVNHKFENFDKFLESESFRILKSNVTGLKINSVHAVSFSDKSILGFIIKIDNLGEYSRDLMTVYNVDEPEKFTTLLRESTVENMNGEVIWYTATYDRLNEMTITDSKISHFRIYTSDKPVSLKNARFSAVQGCSWHCTTQEFNREYQAAKDKCERDWECDFACSFNPCAIAYLAAATAACTTCNFQ